MADSEMYSVRKTSRGRTGYLDTTMVPSASGSLPESETPSPPVIESSPSSSNESSPGILPSDDKKKDGNSSDETEYTGEDETPSPSFITALTTESSGGAKFDSSSDTDWADFEQDLEEQESSNASASSSRSANVLNRDTTAERSLSLRRNSGLTANLTLNLTPEDNRVQTPPTSSSPTFGRFKVTTCSSDTDLNKNRVPQTKDTTQQASPAPNTQKEERILSPYERLQQYVENPGIAARSGIAIQYVNFIRDSTDPESFLVGTAKLFERFTADPDVGSRTSWLDNIPNIVRAYKPAFKRLRLMGFLGECVRDENYNVRRSAQVAIGQLLDFAPDVLSREALTASLVPILIQIFYAEMAADIVIDSLNLFCKILDRIGPEPVRMLFIPEFKKLSGSDVAQVRQSCAQNLHLVTRYLTVTQAEEFNESDDCCRSVQERTIALAQDIMWHVRESTASVYPQIAEQCHKQWPNFTRNALYAAFTNLLNDQAKQVKRMASRGLGRVIACSADVSKTRLQITNSGTVEFIPPASFPRPFVSESDDFDLRSSPVPMERSNSRGSRKITQSPSPLEAVSGKNSLSPGSLAQGLLHPRRNYYSRLGITSTAPQQESASSTALTHEEQPKFNSFQFWQNPLPDLTLKESTSKTDPGSTASNDVVRPEEAPVPGPVEIVEAATDGEASEEEIIREEMDKLIDHAVESVEGHTDHDEPAPSQPIETAGDIGHSDAKPQNDTALENTNVESTSKENMKHGDESAHVTSNVLEESDETRSVSSASSIQDISTAHRLRPLLPAPSSFSTSYDIDGVVIEKHRSRDSLVLNQLSEAGEIAGRIEDILPTLSFLREFTSLARDTDRETVIQIATDFPAVAFTVGRQFWPEIRQCHKTLATSDVPAARERIACSLPRIAEIVGYYHTLVDLVPLINAFLKDNDSVKLAMIENYSAFIMRLPPEVRPMYLLRLCEFFNPDEERNWRYRNTCAEQIGSLAMLFPPKLVVRSLMDGAWYFARDRTAEVRRSACLALSAIFQRIEQQRDTHSRTIFLQKLDLFLRSEDYKSRQVFAQICEDLLSKAALNLESFSFYFGERFWPLFDDRVVAVRLAAARCLLHVALQGRRQSQYAKALEKLQRDSSRSVNEVYQNIVVQLDWMDLCFD